MTVNFTLSVSDYKQVLNAVLINALLKNVPFALVASLSLVALNFKSMEGDVVLCTLLFLGIFAVSISLATPYILVYFRSRKAVSRNLQFVGEKMITLDTDGFSMGNDELKKHHFHDVYSIENFPDHFVLSLKNHSFYIISKRDLSDFEKEAISAHFYGKTFSGGNPTKRNYWVGLFGLIPGIGLVIGLFLGLTGFYLKDNKLKIIASVNFLVSFLYFIGFNPFADIQVFGKKSNADLTIVMLNTIASELKIYKKVNGFYPENISELKRANKNVMYNEIFVDIKRKETSGTKFFYERIQSGYVLKSYGPDCILNTSDDIFPTR